jgi:hypothetical protein
MAAVAPPAHGHAPEHEEHYGGILRWVTTTNHKDIGTLYLWFSGVMFLVGGVMALVIRAELFEPGLQLVSPDFYNQLVTSRRLRLRYGSANFPVQPGEVLAQRRAGAAKAVGRRRLAGVDPPADPRSSPHIRGSPHSPMSTVA